MINVISVYFLCIKKRTIKVIKNKWILNSSVGFNEVISFLLLNISKIVVLTLIYKFFMLCFDLCYILSLAIDWKRNFRLKL